MPQVVHCLFRNPHFFGDLLLVKAFRLELMYLSQGCDVFHGHRAVLHRRFVGLRCVLLLGNAEVGGQPLMARRVPDCSGALDRLVRSGKVSLDRDNDSTAGHADVFFDGKTLYVVIPLEA